MCTKCAHIWQCCAPGGGVRAVGVPPISPVSLLGECIHVLRESVASLVAQTVSTLHHEPLHSISINYIVILCNFATLSCILFSSLPQQSILFTIYTTILCMYLHCRGAKSSIKDCECHLCVLSTACLVRDTSEPVLNATTGVHLLHWTVTPQAFITLQ